ncbi:hypothetical protein OIU76_019435, partial [Salix suchowensis]
MAQARPPEGDDEDSASIAIAGVAWRSSMVYSESLKLHSIAIAGVAWRFS